MPKPSKRFNQLRLRAPRPDDPADTTPLPIYHHPIVSISAILIVASLGQICVWLIRTRLVNSPPLASSAATVHGWLYEFLIDRMSLWLEGVLNFDTIIFLVLLGLGLLSHIAWYVAIRLAFGPAWGLTAGLTSAAHPGMAFLIQQPASFVLIVLLVPVCLALLFWWKTSSHRIWIAPLLGFALASVSLVGSIGICMLPIVVFAMCWASGRLHTRILCAILCVAVYSSILVPWWFVMLGEPQRVQLQYKVEYDLWSSVESGDHTPMALAAHRWLAEHPQDKVPSASRFLLSQARNAPAIFARWITSRTSHLIAATSDGRFKRPLLVIQVLTLLPAVWGCIVALNYPPWRWAASVGLSLVVLTWLLAAIAEPLARNLAPIAGMGMAFMLIGIADIYERLFGRRLTANIKTRSSVGVI